MKSNMYFFIQAREGCPFLQLFLKILDWKEKKLFFGDRSVNSALLLTLYPNKSPSKKAPLF